MSIVQHSAKSVEHYTPREYIEAAREVMGSIDLDPATTRDVNIEIVKAPVFYTESDDGLVQPWDGNVWLNPPGGTIRGVKRTDISSRTARWWEKLVDEYEAGRVKQACFMGFTLEIIRTSQHPYIAKSVVEFPNCYPTNRIDFWVQETDENGDITFSEQGQPAHANVIAYLPDRDDPWSVQRFADVFSKFGAVR